MQYAVAIKALQKTYKGGVEALKGIDLDIQEGDFFALLGPNGAGKSTLIGILSGLVNKTAGEVRVFGISTDEDKALVKTFIGLVPQEFNFNLFEKVLDIVVNQAGYYGIPRAKALVLAEPILRDLALWEKRDTPARMLSGGMKRRLMIARALIHHPKLLVLDEPSAGVDVELRRDMWKFLTALNKSGTTIILTTHYLEEAEQLCRNIAMINKGKIILHEPMQELLARSGQKRLEEIYVEMVSHENE